MNVTPTIKGLVQLDEGYWDGLAPWLPLIHDIQQCKSQGHSVVTVGIIVDSDGQPRWWSRPKYRHIHPKSRDEALEALIEGLGD